MANDTSDSHKNHDPKDQDLGTILDTSQRAELTLLIANITEAMRALIEQAFNPSATLNQDLINPKMSEDEKLMNANIDPGTVDVEAFDKERALLEAATKEVGSPEMKKLKETALASFEEWREEVVARVGEVVNRKEAAEQQKAEVTASKTEILPQPQAPSHKVLSTGKKNSASTKLRDLYPPTKTPLTKLEIPKRMLVLHSVLLLLLSLEHYNAYSRILLLNLTSSLKLSMRTLAEDEIKVAHSLLQAAKEMSGDEEAKKKVEANRDSRKWKVGLASVAGAALLGVTGGLAAPLVAAGVGSVMGGLGLGATAAAGYLGTVAGSTVIVGGLFGAYGGRMTGQMMDSYARDVEDFAFLPVHSSKTKFESEKDAANEDRRLRVVIGISGWLREEEEVVKPWKVIGNAGEVFALRWELESLMNLGNAIATMVSSAAWGYAKKEIISRTVLAELSAALWPIGLLKISRVVDNPFSVAKARADKAGEVLADALINRAQGERPVTLIGYSLGARLIYTCLKSLAKRQAFGLVESVVLMGSPCPSTTKDWRIMRSVVAGRLVNVYSENDYILGFLYRTSSIQYGVAGLQRVEGLDGVENVDLTEKVSGHQRYRYLVGAILAQIGFEDIDMAEVAREEEALQKLEEEEEQNSLRNQKDRLMRQAGYGKDAKGSQQEVDEQEVQELEKEVQSRTQKSLMQRALGQLSFGGTKSKSQSPDLKEKGLEGESGTQSLESSGYWTAAKGHLPNLSGVGFGKKAPAVVGDATDKIEGNAPEAAGQVPVKDTTSKVGDEVAAATPSTAGLYWTAAKGYVSSVSGMRSSNPAAPVDASSVQKPDVPSDVPKIADDPTKAAANSAKVPESDTKIETDEAKDKVPNAGKISAM